MIKPLSWVMEILCGSCEFDSHFLYKDLTKIAILEDIHGKRTILMECPCRICGKTNSMEFELRGC